MVNVGKPGLLGSSFTNLPAYFSFAVHPPWLLLFWLPQGMKGDNGRRVKFISLVLSALVSSTCCVDLLTLIPGSDPWRQLTSRLALTSSLRTRDPGDLMLSKSWRDVSCWEVSGSARRPGIRQVCLQDNSESAENASYSPKNLLCTLDYS